MPDCMSVHHMHVCAHRRQRKESDALELDLQTVVCHQVGARNRIPLQEEHAVLTSEAALFPLREWLQHCDL